MGDRLKPVPLRWIAIIDDGAGEVAPPDSGPEYPPPLFCVSVAAKGLSFRASSLESTVARGRVDVGCKGVSGGGVGPATKEGAGYRESFGRGGGLSWW
jgi:hypothetical protein